MSTSLGTAAAMVHDDPVTDSIGARRDSRDIGPPEDTEEAVQVLTFVSPVAGFPEQRRFVLVALEPSGLLCALRSLDEPDLRFLVVPPGTFFPDYEPELTDSWVEMLALKSAEEALVLAIVTPGDSAAEATANLLAPVVINLRTRQAAQVVLDDTGLPLRAPLRAGA